MKLPEHEAFHVRNLDDLRSEIARLELDIPVAEDLSPLAEPLPFAGRTLSNRFCALPLEGCDANPDGSPDRLTLRRYTQYAVGGFGLIWIEATSVSEEALSNPAQLYLHPHNVAAFAKFAKAIRQAADRSPGQNVVLILQLAHSGRYSRPNGTPRPILVHHNPDADRLQNISPSQPLATDDDLNNLQTVYVAAARLAAEAGFDGIDVKSCHQDLIAELHAASTRPGPYGGSFDNRTRFLLETIGKIKAAVPELLITSRLSVYDAIPYPYGFGVDKDDHRTPDLKEPLRLVKKLQQAGIAMLSVTAGTPSDSKNEHPLQSAARLIDITRTIQKAFPSLPVVGGGYSWFRHFLPHVAAGVIRNGGASIVGLGRSALAYPNAPADILKMGRMDPAKCCITCSACLDLVEDGGATGCVIRDNKTYGESYRHRHHFSVENLREEARRCHYCDSANCTESCPAHMDIPAFVKAFADNDLKAAYDTMRRSNVLPEMCSHLCPTWLMCEGACIEGLLTGEPIPIRDIQYAISWFARTRGLVGAALPEPERFSNPPPHLSPLPPGERKHPQRDGSGHTHALGNATRPASPPEGEVGAACAAPGEGALDGIVRLKTQTGHRIAVVGGGPAGLAGTVALIERGHHVTIIEQEDQLGGTPELVIRASRYPGAKAEIDAILQPALKAGRLDIRFGQKLGRDVTLENLRKQYDAVLLAGGVWQEASIGEPALPTAGLRQERARGSSPLQNRASSGGWSARDTAPSGMNGTAPQGVVDALTFLRQAKRGELKSVPRQVAVLGGGDSAMDAAAVAQELGAEDLYVVYPGPFSEMHWHMPDDWFRTSGAHCLTLTQPVGYQADSKGRLTGLTVCRNELGPADGSGRRQRVPVQGSQSVLKVGLVIEAMGLGVSDELKKALQGISWEDSGLVRTVSAGSFATGLDRVFVAGALINGGASAVQCISEGMKAAEEIDGVLGS